MLVHFLIFLKLRKHALFSFLIKLTDGKKLSFQIKSSEYRKAILFEKKITNYKDYFAFMSPKNSAL